MKNSKVILFAVVAATMAIPATGYSQVDLSRLIQGGKKIVQAIQVSDDDIAAYVSQYIAQEDKKNTILGPDTDYGKRLARLTDGLTAVEGIPLNFKVYKNDQVNAFACADGSVRVYSGLLDVMTDNEVLGVIGHEMGHVAHHDTKKAFKQALINSALKDGIASTDSRVAKLTDSQIGAVADALASSKYSRKQEEQADDYGYDYLLKCGKNPAAMVQAFQRLQAIEQNAGQTTSFVNNLFSSHPEIGKRIKNMQKRALADGYMDKDGNILPTAAEKAAAEKAAKEAKSKKKSTTTKKSKTTTKKSSTSTKKSTTSTKKSTTPTKKSTTSTKKK